MDYEFPNDNVINGVGISGSGGGKAGGSGSQGKEAPNTLRSKAIARFVFLLGEGEIPGLVNGAKSIIINKVPYENLDGSKNFKGLSYAFRPGTPDQEPIKGFESITSEFDVGLRIRYNQPVTYRTQGSDLDAIIATLSIPQLTRLDEKDGSLKGYYFNVAIDIKNLNNPANEWFPAVAADYKTGKNTSPYERSYRIEVAPPGPWLVRFKRLTADSDDNSKLADETYFSRVTEVYDHKIAYSDSAVMGVEIDAEQFGSSGADIHFDIYGKIINYPSNYEPTTGVYTGFWDGTWSFGYCNNPAWVLLDVCLNPRYGIGIPIALMDKWGLYVLAQYCDMLVPDGIGGTERRFTFNGTMYNAEDAYKVVQQIASMMRAIVFYGSGAVMIRQDSPMSPQQRLYTPANVVGEFSYSSTARGVRHNACQIQWVNPELGYENDYEVYEDREAILKQGYNLLSLQAIGTTSRGQAYRQAKWAVLTEQLQYETITFEAGLDSHSVLPGDLFEVADPHWATADFGGRLSQPEAINIFTTANCAVSSWGANGGTPTATDYQPGPFGARNLIKFAATAASATHHLALVKTSGYTVGANYTFSYFVRSNNSDYFAIVTSGGTVGGAVVQLSTGKVRRIGGAATAASVQDFGEGLYRVTLTFIAAADTSTTFYSAFSNVNSAGVASSGGRQNWVALGTEEAWFGAPQLELGLIATAPRIGRPNGTTQVQLDRDIEYTGATSPALHVTLLDGPMDDIANVDNAGRPIKRKIRYFSSNITAYSPETQIVTLQTAISAEGNDELTPLVWIFSKNEVVPRAFKVITNESTDDGSYVITGINYSTEKFVQMDENFEINYDPGNNVSNLPTTRFCEPPANLKVEPTTRLVSGSLHKAINISFEASKDKFLLGYVISYKRDDENWISLPVTFEMNEEIEAIVGNYIFEVRAINKFGISSKEITNGLSISETSATGQTAVISLYSDRGDNTFTGRDINLYWLSNALSQAVKTPAIVANVIKAGGTTVVNVDGELEVQGGVGSPSVTTATVSIANPDAPTITLTGTFQRGDNVELFVGMSRFVYSVSALTATSTTVASGLKTLVDADPRFTATSALGVVTLGFVGTATNALNLSAHNDPMFRRYRIQVRDSGTNALKRTDYTEKNEYVYTFAMNELDFVTPSRTVKLEVDVQDIEDDFSASASLTLTNPQPVPPSVLITSKLGVVNISYQQPTDPDFAGIIVYMSTVSGFTPGPANEVYRGSGQPAIPASAGVTYYIKYGFYDAFGLTGIALSTQQIIVAVGVTGADFDATPPGVPTLPATPLSSATTNDPVTQNPVTTLTFTWNAVGDSDLNRYEVALREGAGGAWVAGYMVGNDTITLSRTVQPNTAYYGRVRAIDDTGNPSTWSAIAGPHTTAKDTVAPSAPTFPASPVQAAFTSLMLSWINPSASDLAYIQIFENTVNNSGTATKITTVNAEPSGVGKFARSGLLTGDTLYYWLKAVDRSGNVSVFSTAVSGTTATVDLPDFAVGLSPIKEVTTNPNPAGYVGPKTILNTTDGKIYRYVGGAWVTSVATVDLVGTVSNAQIADNAISVAKFASGLAAVELLASLPTTGNFTGRHVFLTATDGAYAANKLYRRTSTGTWVTGSAATDITGQLTSAQIADIAAIKITGTLSSSQIADLAATKITGQLTSAQIADLAATKVTGTLSNAQIADLAASKITGQLTNTQIADLAASKISGTLSNSQIADLAAGKITGTLADAQIAAISAAKLTGQIVGTQITDGAILTPKLAANSVTASKLVVTDNTNLLLSMDLTDATYYDNITGFTLSLTTANVFGDYYARTEDGNGTTSQATALFYPSKRAPVEAGKSYRCFADIYYSADFTGIVYFQVSFYDAVGVLIVADTSVRGLDNRTTANLSGLGIIEGMLTAPAGAKNASIRMMASWSTTLANAGHARFTRPRFMRAASGELIVDGSITTAKLVANVITANEIAANAVTAVKISAGTITGDKLVANTITAAQIAALTITANEIAAGAITTAKLVANAVTANEIASNAITAVKIQAGTITGDKLVANTITAAQIAALTITAAEIAAGAITTAKLVANAITANELAANAVTAVKIQAGTIDASKLVANTITAGQIAALTITGTEIAANAITAAKILAGTITANEIASDTITAGQIAAGAISASEIAAGAITATKLAVTDNNNLILSGIFTDTDYWNNVSGFTVVTGTNNVLQENYFKTPEGDGTTSQSLVYANSLTDVTVEAGKAYRAFADLYYSPDFTGLVYFSVAFYDGTGALISTNNTDARGPDNRVSTVFGGGLTTVNGIITAPASSTKARIYLCGAWSFTRANVGHARITRPRFMRAMSGELIVDGSITTSKLVANVITANELATNSVTTVKIIASAITATELATDAVTANKILAGSITTAKIATNAITASKVFIGDTSNMVADPSIEDLAAWQAVGAATFGFVANPSTSFSTNLLLVNWGAAGIQRVQTSPIPIEEGLDYYISAVGRAVSSGNSQANIYVRWYSDLAGTTIINTPVVGTNSTTAYTKFSGIFNAPAGARRARMLFDKTAGPTTDTVGAYFGSPVFRKAAGGELIVDGAITTSKMTANTINGDRITTGTLDAAKITAGTILAGTVTVSGTALSTVVTNASTGAGDPVTRINAGATYINPGKVLISGSTYLSNWMNGTDATKIEGGAVAANTILANSLQIGIRGIDLAGLAFTANSPTVNKIAWSAGTINYINDSGTATSAAISSSTGVTWTSGTVYIYWIKGGTTLSNTTTQATAYGANNIVLASYRGGTDMVVSYGRTIIDGVNIVTGTITADRLKAGEIFTQDLYVGGSTLKLAGSNGGAGKGAILIKNAALTVNLVELGWQDASNVGLRMRNAAGQIIIDQTYNPLESGADVTSAIAGPAELLVNCDYLGAPLTGELPLEQSYKLIRNGVDVTTSSAWSVTTKIGTLTRTIGAATGVFSVTAISNDSVVRLQSVYLGTTRVFDVKIRKILAAPPVAGGGAGNYAQDTTFLAINSATMASITDELTVTVSGTSVTCTASLNVRTARSAPDGFYDVKGIWQWYNAGTTTWTDLSTETSSDPDTSVAFDSEAGIYYIDQDGVLNVVATKTGLTAASSQKFRFRARNNTGTRSMTFTGSASAQG